MDDPPPPTIPESVWVVLSSEIGEGETKKKKTEVHCMNLTGSAEGDLVWESKKGGKVSCSGGKWIVESGGGHKHTSDKDSTDGWLPHESEYGDGCKVTENPPVIENSQRPPIRMPLCGYQNARLPAAVQHARDEQKKAAMQKVILTRQIAVADAVKQEAADRCLAMQSDPPVLEGSKAATDAYQREVLRGKTYNTYTKEHLDTVIPPTQSHDAEIMIRMPPEHAREYALQMQFSTAFSQMQYEHDRGKELRTPYRPVSIPRSSNINGISHQLAVLKNWSLGQTPGRSTPSRVSPPRSKTVLVPPSSSRPSRALSLLSPYRQQAAETPTMGSLNFGESPH